MAVPGTMRILHIVPDHGKFVEDAMGLFDELQGVTNEWAVCKKAAVAPKELDSRRVKGISHSDFVSLECENKTHDVIIIHNFGSLPYRIIKNIHKEIRVVLFTWGGDIYDLCYPEYSLIPIRGAIRRQKFSFYKEKYFNISYIKTLISKFIKSSFRPRRDFKEAIRRIDYYSGVFPLEWDLIKRYNPEFKAKKISFSYTSRLSPICRENINKGLDNVKTNIQVGHSGYFLLNHLRVFGLLKDKVTPGMKIITPLSYSPNSEKHTHSIIEAGERMFGEAFTPLKDFVDYESYVKLMSSVNVAIFDIDRQCGVGNCMIAVWNGAKVFFPKESVNYKFFSEIGVKIYTIEEDLTSSEISSSMTKDEILHNRNALIKNWSYDVVKEKLIKSIELIRNDMSAKV